MATNPFARARARHGMSVSAFALSLDVHPTTVESAENGEIVFPRKLALALGAAAGEDPAALLEEYRAWRALRRADFRSRLVTKA